MSFSVNLRRLSNLPGRSDRKVGLSIRGQKRALTVFIYFCGLFFDIMSSVISYNLQYMSESRWTAPSIYFCLSLVWSVYPGLGPICSTEGKLKRSKHKTLLFTRVNELQLRRLFD